jgi:DNA-binding transcriptional regulator YdaS (Cro superfamily)
MPPISKQQLLRRAANLVGQQELATRMKVPPPVLDAWINGRATMPDRKLIALAAVLDKVAHGK